LRPERRRWLAITGKNNHERVSETLGKPRFGRGLYKPWGIKFGHMMDLGKLANAGGRPPVKIISFNKKSNVNHGGRLKGNRIVTRWRHGDLGPAGGHTKNKPEIWGGVQGTAGKQ